MSLVVCQRLGYLGLIFLAAWLVSYEHPRLGYGYKCSADDCLVWVSLSWYAILGCSILLFLVWRVPSLRNINLKTRVGGIRRTLAFYIDFAICMVMAVIITPLPDLLVEALYEGTFSWSFSRDYSRVTDGYLMVSSFVISILGIYAYQHLFMRKQMSTPGQYILGYRVIWNDGPPSHSRVAKRVIRSMIGLCVWPVSAFMASRDTKKRYSWDLATNSFCSLDAHK